MKYADYVVCISQFVKDDFEKNIALFRPKKLKKIEVIHNGIQLPEDRKYHLGKFAHLAAKKYLLNIGVLFDKKNQLKLVEMLPFLEQDLVLLASGEKESYATEVRKRIKELNLQNRIHILKNISEEEKYALIQNCEAMSSVYCRRFRDSAYRSDGFRKTGFSLHFYESAGNRW